MTNNHRPLLRRKDDRHAWVTFDLPFRTDVLLWFNAVEGLFAKLTHRHLKHGVFHSVVDLQDAITASSKSTISNPTLRLESQSRCDHRNRQARAPDVGINP